MKVAKDNVVSMHYKLTGPDGQVLDSSEGGEPLAYLHGHGNIIPGLEKQMEGKSVGDKFTASVAAADAYGEVNPELIVEATRAQFPEGTELEPGMRFQASTPGGQTIAEIKKIEGEKVTVDTNHPLAGMDLKFEVEITNVREAAADEIDHGHVH